MKKIMIVMLAIAASVCAMAQAEVRVATDSDIATEEPIFYEVEQDPEFDGGMAALYQSLATNIHYPEDAREEKVQGKVYVQFVVEKDGSVSNVKILRSPDERLSAEAERVVKAMPKWKPGKVGGKKVRVQYVLPINFQLNSEKK